MTIKELHDLWQAVPAMHRFATNTRQNFLSAMGEDITREAEDITLDTAADIIRHHLPDPADRVRAASVLVYVLSYGASTGQCPAPSFSYQDIANTIKCKEGDKVASVPSSKFQVPSVKSQETKEQEPIKKPKRKKKAKRKRKPVTTKGRRGLPPVTILQMDRDGNVVRQWSSITEAKRAIGGNIARALNRHYVTHGFYWSYLYDIETVRAIISRGDRPRSTAIETYQVEIGTGEVLRIWHSGYEAEKTLGIRGTSAAARKGHQCKGYYWATARNLAAIREKASTATVSHRKSPQR